jgi:hypothetical protein
MSTSDFVVMKQLRGLKANLPASAPAGQLIITTDTSELFYGTGTGVEQIGAGSEHQTRYSIYDDNQAVYADGMPGTYDPKARDGWYFTNTIAGQKINWYYYDPSVLTTTVAQFVNTYAVVTIDTNKVPYFAIYTLGTDFEWFKSKRVYAVQSPVSVTPGKYLVYTGQEPSVYPELPRIRLTETTSLSAGAFAPTETIMTMTLQTESGSAAGNYKFVTHQLGFETSSTTRQIDLKIKSNSVRTFTQSTPASTWTIVHNMGTYPKITTVDNGGALIEGNVTYASANVITVEFSPAVSGKAYFI